MGEKMSNKTIHELDSLTEITQNDEMLIYDISAGADNPTKKTTVGTIKNYMADNIKDVYSTDEVKTNKVWIDGKPIYRKVWYWQNVTSGAKDNLASLHIDKIVIINPVISEGTYIFQPYFSDTSYSRLLIDKSNWNLIWDKSAGTADWIVLTIEYTKTTD